MPLSAANHGYDKVPERRVQREQSWGRLHTLEKGHHLVEMQIRQGSLPPVDMLTP